MELGLVYVILCVILTDDTSGCGGDGTRTCLCYTVCHFNRRCLGYGGDATRTSLQHVKL